MGTDNVVNFETFELCPSLFEPEWRFGGKIICHVQNQVFLILRIVKANMFGIDGLQESFHLRQEVKYSFLLKGHVCT